MVSHFSDIPEGIATWGLLVVLSTLIGVVLILTFRGLAQPDLLRALRQRIKAHVLEITIFKDDLRVFGSASRSIFLLSARYLGHNLVAFSVMIVPVLVILWLADPFLGYRPLRPGEHTIVSLIGRNGTLPDRKKIGLIVECENGTGFSISEPLVIPGNNEVSWRVTAEREGRAMLILQMGETKIGKKLLAGKGVARVLTKSELGGSLWRNLLYPLDGFKTRDLQGFFCIDYPERQYELMGFRHSWMVWFFLFSILASLLAGVILKRRP